MHVTLLTRRECGFCDQAKQILGRLSQEFSLAVSMVDMDSEEGQVLAERGGVMFPPGIFLDGETFSYGRPSERKLRKELERRLSHRA
jgi:glutaredoxin